MNTKVNFIYKDDEKDLDLKGISLEQSSMIKAMSVSINEIVAKYNCPRHSNSSHITIVLNVGSANYQWDIYEACCNDFLELLKTKIGEVWH